MSITKHQIQDAINLHGAVNVHAAAIAQMEGKVDKFSRMGFEPENLGCVYKVLQESYRQMGDANRAINFAKTQAELEKFRNDL
jgi:hypothetical protein